MDVAHFRTTFVTMPASRAWRHPGLAGDNDVVIEMIGAQLDASSPVRQPLCIHHCAWGIRSRRVHLRLRLPIPAAVVSND